MIHNIKIELRNKIQFTKNQIVRLIHNQDPNNITNIKFIALSRIDGLPIFEIDSNTISNTYSLISHKLMINNQQSTIKDIQIISSNSFDNLSNHIVNQNKDKIVDFILEQLNIPIIALNDEDSHKSIIRQLKLNNIMPE
jgi:hypothetical protein